MDEMKSLLISTDSLPERDRVEAFREIFGRTILRIEMEPLGEAPFDIEMKLRALPEFGLASGRLSPMANRHTGALIDNDDLVLVVMQSGFGIAQQHGREATVSESQAVLTSNGDPATFTGPVNTQVTNFRFNRGRLSALVADLDGSLLRPIPASTPALRLLADYVAQSLAKHELDSPRLNELFTTHVHDLAALAMGATRDATAAARSGGLRAARLNAIKADIIRHIADNTLSVASIADRHHVTPRYVHMLFAAEEHTFTEFLIEQRLTRTHRLLTDARLADRTISGIAFEVGFTNISYFNRVFRRRYGASPSDIRDAARRARE
jgi:AraC-like DNA-binding protein